MTETGQVVRDIVIKNRKEIIGPGLTRWGTQVKDL